MTKDKCEMLRKGERPILLSALIFALFITQSDPSRELTRPIHPSTTPRGRLQEAHSPVLRRKTSCLVSGLPCALYGPCAEEMN